ncbi:MAG: hypothetical protein RL662_776 [Bacteroidota bacterium]|jgi:hypothetical protein
MGSEYGRGYGSDLAPQQLLDEAAKILAKDQARLSGLSYPVYKGQTVAPMSSLTQRARTLKEGFAKKPAPYSRKLETVLNRSNAGIDPTRQLEMLGQRQQDFSDNRILGALRKQFRESYDPRIDRFRGKGQRDVQMGLREASGELGDIGRASGVLEQSSNEQLVKALQALQAQKEARREGLTGTLEQFGAQKHGYTNLVNQAQRNQFNEEAAAPYRRMERLREALGPLSANMESTHPDIQAQSGKDALQALRAYGVDVSAPVGSWGDARTAPATYKGQLMANLPPEILASHSTLEAVNPKFKDTSYDQRKALLRQLMTDRGVGQRAEEAVPERMRGAVEGLEYEAKQKLKKDLAAINNRFIQANQYGSPQHMREAERRAREVSKATLGERNKLLQESMKSELTLGHQGQLSNLRQLGLYGDQGQKEFGDTLSKIRDMNKLGSTKWGNEQAENEDLYKNYQNEAAWEWPHMKGVIAGNARSGALGDVFRGLSNRGIGLDQLAALNTNYSELQKENANRRAELDTRDSTINDLYKQLGVFNKQRDTDLMTQRLLDATRESDEATNWWNTGGSRNGDFNTNWKRVQTARDKLEAIQKEVRASGNLGAFSQAFSQSNARTTGYNKAWDANLAQRASEETARLEALKKAASPMEQFNRMNKYQQYAYRNYPSEGEFLADNARLGREYFGSDDWKTYQGQFTRVPEAQRAAFWNKS